MTLNRAYGCRLWLALGCLLGGGGPLPAQEFRAFWADAFHAGFRSPAEVSRLVADVRGANANAIVVEVRKRGDAYYASRYEPWATDISPPGFDPLADLLAKARDTNAGPRIEVHAWIVTYPIWANQSIPPPQPNHPYNLHPEWLSEDRNGNRYAGAYYLLDPGHPGVQEHTFNVAMDIVTHYDVDGLNLDYVRYPNYNWGYNPAAVARFNKRFDRTGLPPSQDPDWLQWRRDQVTALVRKVYLSARAARPGITLSADTITWTPSVTTDVAWTNFARAYNEVLQDWRSWMEEGILDLNLPMNYYRQNIPNYAADYRNWKNFAVDRAFGRQVAIGPGIYLNSISNGIHQMRLTREPSPSGALAQGVCAYSYAVPASNAIPNLQGEFLAALIAPSEHDPLAPPIFATPVPTPAMPWKTGPATGHIKGFVRLAPGAAGADAVTVNLSGPGGRSLRTDATGFFGAVDLLPGSYVLSLDYADHQPYVTNLLIAGGSVSHCEILLQPALPFLNLTVVPGERSALVTWATPVAATSQVEFGQDASYGRLTPLNPQPALQHAVLLTGLDPASAYCLRAISRVGAEDHRSVPVCFRTSPEIILDNPQAVFAGSWSTGNSAAGRYLHDYHYVSAVAGAATRAARYTPIIITAGYYDVFAWYPAGSNRSTNAPHRVVFDGGEVLVHLNQQTGGGAWRLLATQLPFRPGQPGYVEIDNATGESGVSRVVMADAIRFAYCPGQDVPTDGSVPAWWAQHYFEGSLDPESDPDGDGYTTGQEYRLGTDPTSAVSRLRCRLEWEPSLRLVFSPRHPDRRYSLERCVDLAAGRWEPFVQPAAVALPNGEGACELPAHETAPALFRLRIDWQ